MCDNLEQLDVLDELHKMIVAWASSKIDDDALDVILWNTLFAFQRCIFYTKSGLAFFYTVKLSRRGEYTGELVVSRKEGSKTLTKSSIMLAFHKVLADMDGANIPEYKGPKAIGQIFGISYIYSIFWNLGLIKVPEKIENRLRGKDC